MLETFNNQAYLLRLVHVVVTLISLPRPQVVLALAASSFSEATVPV
jgi:hypothetical protein